MLLLPQSGSFFIGILTLFHSVSFQGKGKKGAVSQGKESPGPTALAKGDISPPVTMNLFPTKGTPDRASKKSSVDPVLPATVKPTASSFDDMKKGECFTSPLSLSFM